MDTTIFGNLHISSHTSPAHLGNTSSSHLQLRERTRYPVSAVLPILLKIHTRFVTHSLRKKDMIYLNSSGFSHTNAEKRVWLVELISFAINQLWKKELLICIDQGCGVQTSRDFTSSSTTSRTFVGFGAKHHQGASHPGPCRVLLWTQGPLDTIQLPKSTQRTKFSYLGFSPRKFPIFPRCFFVHHRLT
jgi:hypothetical protein